PPNAMYLALLLLLTTIHPDLDTPPKYKAWVDGHEVWADSADGPRRVAHDALAAEPVAASPSGDRVVYAALNPKFDERTCSNTPRKFVVLVNRFGQSLWRTELSEACEDFSKFEWIDDGRIGVVLC